MVSVALSGGHWKEFVVMVIVVGNTHSMLRGVWMYWRRYPSMLVMSLESSRWQLRPFPSSRNTHSPLLPPRRSMSTVAATPAPALEPAAVPTKRTRGEDLLSTFGLFRAELDAHVRILP